MHSTKKTAVFAAIGLLMSCSAGFAQTTGEKVPDPAHPAPANPSATNGAPTEAPAKGDSMKPGSTAKDMPERSMKKM